MTFSMSKYTEQLGLRITPEQKAVLEELAEERNTSASAIARQILSAGIDQVVNQGEDPAQISILDEG